MISSPSRSFARSSKWAALADSIRAQIERGELSEGARLPTVLSLCEQFGVSVSTVDKATMALEREGLIRRVAGSGVFVAPRPTSKRRGVIALWDEAFENGSPYWAALMRGIGRGASEAGVEVLLLHEKSLPDWDGVDGLLLSNVAPLSAIRRLSPTLPVVSLLLAAHGLPSVTLDERAAGQLAGRALREAGHSRVASLLLPGVNAQTRLSGFLSVLPDAGPGLHRTAPFAPGQFASFREWGRVAMENWLAEGFADLGATAMLAYNDDAAVGVLDALRERGLRVPDDFSLVCFDGTAICDYTTPSLCAVQTPLEEIGARGVSLLLDLLAGAAPVAPALVLPPNLKSGRLARAAFIPKL